MTTAATRVRWFRSLSCRLALILAGLMVCSVLLRPLLVEWTFALTGLPSEQVASKLDLAALVGDGLLQGAGLDARGRPLLREDRRRRTEALLRGMGAKFAVLDRELEVLAASPELQLRPGHAWPKRAPDHEPIDRRFLVGAAPGPELQAYYVPLRRKGRDLGTFVLLLEPRIRRQATSVSRHSLVAAVRELPALESQPPMARTLSFIPRRVLETRRWRRGIAVTLEWLIPLLVVLSLSFVIARLVTRRLAQLSEACATPAGAQLPGPFPVAGRDEIAVLGASLNTMRSQALELLAEREQRVRDERAWAAQISHDLRTPLTALHACLDRATQVSAEELPQLLQVARMDAERVGVLAEGLLEIARLDSGEALRLEELQAEELVGQVSRALQPLAAASARRIELSIDADLPRVRADGQRLLRVLENLLRNAIHHAREVVTLAVRHTVQGVELVVSDDGKGFAGGSGEVDLEALRCRGAGSGHSTGIGLQVASRIAHAHGSQLRARNLGTGGACVGLVLRVAAPDSGRL